MLSAIAFTNLFFTACSLMLLSYAILTAEYPWNVDLEHNLMVLGFEPGSNSQDIHHRFTQNELLEGWIRSLYVIGACLLMMVSLLICSIIFLAHDRSNAVLAAHLANVIALVFIGTNTGSGGTLSVHSKLYVGLLLSNTIGFVSYFIHMFSRKSSKKAPSSPSAANTSEFKRPSVPFN